MLSYGLGHDQHLHVRRSNLFQGPYNKRIHSLGNSAVRTLNIEFQIDTLASRRLILTIAIKGRPVSGRLRMFQAAEIPLIMVIKIQVLLSYHILF